MRLTSTLLFAATALIGLMVAYDARVGLGRFGLIMLGLALAGCLTLIGRFDRDKRVVGWLAYGSLWGAGLLAIAYLFWGGTAVPEGGVVFMWRLNNGVAGGLAALLPVGIAALVWLWLAWRTDGEPAAGIAAFVGLIPLITALIALVATGSRGALTGLVVGSGVALYLLWRMTGGRASALRWLGDVTLILLAAGLVVGFLDLLLAPQLPAFLAALGNDSSAVSRPVLWRDTLPLLQDYRFTGSGLGGVGMVFSTYIFLLHVGYYYHAHNLYLQIGLEQGLPGLIAFLCMAAATLWMAARSFRSGWRANALTWGALAGILAILVHGLVEAELYATALTPLFFLPFGFAWALQPAPEEAYFDQDMQDTQPLTSHPAIAVAVGAAPVVLSLLLFMLPGARAAFQANLGAISQTQTELSRYSWPEWPIQDALRRDPNIALTTAIERYQAALRLNSDNVTALRRLGQIALSRGELDAARDYLEHAYTLAPQQRPTRQLLGEVYALSSDAEKAAELWATVETDQGQLDLRRWWTAETGTQADVANLAKALTRLREIEQKTNP